MRDVGSPRKMSSMLWRILVAALLLVPAAAFVIGDLTSHDEPRPPRPAVILPADSERRPSPGPTPGTGKPDRPGKPGTGKKEPTPKSTPRPPASADDCDDDETTVQPCPDDVDDDDEGDDAGSDDGDDG
jgi:hypothetical protein